jgi:hypothetical protein
MKRRMVAVFLVAAVFCWVASTVVSLAAEQNRTKADDSPVTETKDTTEKVTKAPKEKGKKGKVATIAKPNSKVKVKIDDEDSDNEVGDVTVVGDDGADVEVNLGSKHVEGDKGNTKIETHYKTGDVTTITGKKSKSSVNIGSVKVGK